jgi:virginiamycin A acetyltransferase
MIELILTKLSFHVYRFMHLWKRSQFSVSAVNYLNSEIIGPVKFEIGNHSYANGIRVYGWQNSLNVTVGKFCSIAEDVVVMAGGEHNLNSVSTSPYFDSLTKSKRINSKGNVTIKNDVWIGHGAIILSGVTIGNGAVVAAGAVVSKEVPPYAIVAGVPAKILRYRFDESIICSLQNISWWDWDEKLLKKRAADFSDVKVFVDKYKPVICAD